MTVNEMKTILYEKLCDEKCNFSKSDISIRKDGKDYKIVIKGYEHIPFRIMLAEYDDYFGYSTYVYADYKIILSYDSKKDYDIKNTLIGIGYYIGTRF